MEKDKILKMFPNMAGWIKEMLIKRYDKVFDNEIGSGWRVTNDPVKMLGCGATVSSSYSPDSPSFDFLPSFVFQPYVMMAYKTNGNTVKFEHNGVELECPEYDNRCFILYNDAGVVCLPSYGKPGQGEFSVQDELETIVIHSPTRPPEIHLDGVSLYSDFGAHYAVFGQRVAPKDWDCVNRWLKQQKVRKDV